MKRLAFFDVDNTVFDGYLTSGFYEYVFENKLVGNWEELQREAKELHAKDRNREFTNHEMSRLVVELTGKVLMGRDQAEVGSWIEHYLISKPSVFEWVRPVMACLRNNGFEIYLISGAAAPLVEVLGRQLLVNGVFASEILVSGNVYSDKYKQIMLYNEKLLAVEKFIAEQGEGSTFLVGFGDAEGDVEMLQRMDVAFLHEPRDEMMLALAKEHGWQVGNRGTMEELVIEVLKWYMGGGSSDEIPDSNSAALRGFRDDNIRQFNK